ncbi:MAG TPA: tRNA-uridine aminocarboxypropyltransferase [Polyangia bacterium]|nr:tRNA-uridine aminocarboxypropyltransferase [Polyangia bacterium]
MRRGSSVERSGRLRCRQCRMHRSLCICGLLPSLQTRTRLVLVLHQLEARKTTNTGRLAARCLTNSRIVIRGRDDDAARPGNREPGSTPALWAAGSQPLLLLPIEDATPLSQWTPSAAPITLIVPDGTWRQAIRTRKRIAGLAGVPCVTLPGTATSRYRLRHDAQPRRLATLEAIAIAMGILEGPSVQNALEQVFAVMVDRTLWTNGRLERGQVTGGIPEGARSHDPLGQLDATQVARWGHAPIADPLAATKK